MLSFRGRRNLAALATTLAVAAVPAAAKQATPIAAVELGGGAVSFAPLVSYGWLTVTVTGPGDVLVRKEFASGESVRIASGEGGRPWPDGQYRYELRVAPADAGAQDALREARGGDAPGSAPASPVAGPPLVQSGGFQVLGGAIVPASYTEGSVNPEFLIAENLYVQGKGCFGIDCVNLESLTGTTIRLKENNTRIQFDDTSTGTFPANDWQLTANDTVSGGLNRFSIDDLTNATTPLTVEAAAPTNSIYVDSTGRVGFRTATPVQDLHVNTGNTPALRLEQNNSSGFTAQTWDVAGNEANFFVRDVTGGSLLPFRIRPGAPTSSLDIAASGAVGIGHAAATAPLHVRRSDGTTQVLIENVDGATQTRRLLDMQNNGGVRMRLSDNSTGTVWAYQNIASEFLIDANGGGNEFRLTTAGNLTISGTLFQNSDRHVKQGITPVDPGQVLAKVAALPISTWSYKADKETVRHVGPMAQDFAAAFGVGLNDRTLAPGDVAGVALAAIQALHAKLEAAEAALLEMRSLHAAQAVRLADLEARLRDVRVQEVHQVLDGHRLVEHGDAHP